MPLGTGSEVRANILMYVDPRRGKSTGKSTFSALVRELVHWSLKKRFHPVPYFFKS